MSRPPSVRASCGAAATMAMLIACAPWEPPRTSTLTNFEVRPSKFEVSRSAKNSARTGLPATNPLSAKILQRGLIGHRRGSHARREQPVCQARHGVLLQHHGRNSAQRRQEHDRSRAVAADANHDVRPASREQPPGVEQSQREEHRATHAGSPAPCPSDPALRITSSSNPSAGTTRASSPRRCRRTSPPRPGRAAESRAPRRCPDKDARRCRHRRSPPSEPGHIRDLSIPRLRDVPSLSRLDLRRPPSPTPAARCSAECPSPPG